MPDNHVQTRYDARTTNTEEAAMKQGTILDFIQLLSENSALQEELVLLAAKHDFEFAPAELTDAELDMVSGGKNWDDALSSIGEDAQLANIDLQNILQKQQRMVQMMSGISKTLHDTALAVIRKMG
jgi:hypothetical protein